MSPDFFLHYSSLSNTFLLLNNTSHQLYSEADDVNRLETVNPNLYTHLRKGNFIVDDDFDECKFVLDQKAKMINSTSLYNVVINTTLDCNLNCWYCYENKIAGSRLQPKVVEAIKKNIALHFEDSPYTTLKLSFFGGEPFMCFDAIKELLSFSKSFCDERNIELIADFTTNATLITKEHIDFLKQFRCHFQITLDGGRENHNQVKKNKHDNIDSYAQTIDALKSIDKEIARRWVAVRVNFNNKTLYNIDEIINDIDFLDRRYTYVILKKVWQIKTEVVDKDALADAIQNFLDHKFLLDYYYMPKGCVCFAERRNQVLFNYDGGIFKCTTISDFNKKNSLGELDFNTGAVIWDPQKTEDWYADMQPTFCKECKWFPVCLGACNRQLMAHRGERICTFDANNLTEGEFLMYLFKYNLLKNELTK